MSTTETPKTIGQARITIGQKGRHQPVMRSGRPRSQAHGVEVRSPPASAEMTRQWNFHAECSSNGSWRSRRALELMDAGGL